MAARSSAGWIVLVVALAVPGFLFFNWWSQLNSENRRQLTVKVRNRLPPGTPMFGQPPTQERLSNPISSGPAEAAPLQPASAPPAAALTAPEAPVVLEPAPQSAAAPQLPPTAAAPQGVVRIGTIAQVVLAQVYLSPRAWSASKPNRRACALAAEPKSDIPNRPRGGRPANPRRPAGNFDRRGRQGHRQRRSRRRGRHRERESPAVTRRESFFHRNKRFIKAMSR